jgi:CHAT domain-containing protein
LPDLEGEVREGALSFPASVVFSRGHFDVQILRQALSRAEVFHFSGHAAVFSGDAALLVPGGALWGSQLSAADLRNCHLAVLAACSTGRAEGDLGPTSVLAKAFLQAGVAHVIAARWDVESRAVTPLMSVFYRELASGSSVERSLAVAAASLRSSPQFASPYYWAAFNLFRA